MKKTNKLYYLYCLRTKNSQDYCNIEIKFLPR